MTLIEKPKRTVQPIDVDLFAERVRQDEPLLEEARRRRIRMRILLVLVVFTLTTTAVLVLRLL